MWEILIWHFFAYLVQIKLHHHPNTIGISNASIHKTKDFSLLVGSRKVRFPPCCGSLHLSARLCLFATNRRPAPPQPAVIGWTKGTGCQLSCLLFASFEQRAQFPELLPQSGNGRVSFHTDGPSRDITQTYFIDFLLWFDKTNTEHHLSAQQKYDLQMTLSHSFFPNESVSPHRRTDTFHGQMKARCLHAVRNSKRIHQLILFQSFCYFKSCPIVEFSPMQWLYRGVHCEPLTGGAKEVSAQSLSS